MDQYKKPEIKILLLNEQDIICTSFNGIVNQDENELPPIDIFIDKGQ